MQHPAATVRLHEHLQNQEAAEEAGRRAADPRIGGVPGPPAVARVLRGWERDEGTPQSLMAFVAPPLLAQTSLQTLESHAISNMPESSFTEPRLAFALRRP